MLIETDVSVNDELDADVETGADVNVDDAGVERKIISLMSQSFVAS